MLTLHQHLDLAKIAIFAAILMAAVSLSLSSLYLHLDPSLFLYESLSSSFHFHPFLFSICPSLPLPAPSIPILPSLFFPFPISFNPFFLLRFFLRNTMANFIWWNYFRTWSFYLCRTHRLYTVWYNWSYTAVSSCIIGFLCCRGQSNQDLSHLELRCLSSC